MPRISIIATVVFALVPTSLAAPQIWVQTLATNKPEWMSDAAPDGTGGAFVIGQTAGSLATSQQADWDFYAAHFSATGSLLWQLQFGAQFVQFGDCIAADGAGGCFVGCTTYGFVGGTPAGVADAAVVRLDATGNIVWAKQFGTDQFEEHVRVAPDGSGGAFVAYDFGSVNGWDGVRDIQLLRLDANGAVLWTQPFGTSLPEWLGDLVADGSGGAYVCGRTEGDLAVPVVGRIDGWLARVDGNGSFQWLVQTGMTGDDGFERLVLDGPDRLFLVGSATDSFTGPGFGQEDVFVSLYDGAGSSTWLRQLGGTGPDMPMGIARDGLDGVFIVGRTDGELFGPQVGGGDAWMAQVRDDGTVAWEHQMGTPVWDAARGVCESTPGRFIVVGETKGALFGVPSVGLDDMFVALFEGCAFSAPDAYCPGVPNSTGAPAGLANQGSTSIGLNDLRFTVAGGPPGEKGIVILGSQQAQHPFGNGTLCLGGSVQRLLPAVMLSAEGKGIYVVDFEDPTKPTSQITPGSTWFFQFWYRDSAAGVGAFNLSNGLSATFCP